MTVPEDRDSILSMYDEFGLEPRSARGFEFQYYAPNAGEELPADLGRLGQGRSIVSFKALDDGDRCRLFARILDAVFEAHAVEESSALKLILLVEEAQRFTKKRVGANAKAAGQAAEVALDRTLREGRKYGCCSIIVSQTIRDFAYDTASIRQNTNTKAFLHNSDREVDYAADFIGDGRQIIQLTTGSAFVYNAAWGIMKVKVRPPYSKVWEFSAADTTKLRAPADAPKVALSEQAQRLLDVVLEHNTGGGSGLNLTEAARSMGVSSKRMLQGLVDELERGGLVRTRKLRQRGQPRIIEPIGSGYPDQTPDTKRS